MYRLKLAYRGLLFSLFFLCTSAGLTAQEGYHEALVVKNSAELISTHSQAVLNLFKDDNSVNTFKKAGFVFVPKLVVPASITPPGPNDVDTLYALGYLAVLSYWGGVNEDSLMLYGLEGDTSIFSFPTPAVLSQSSVHPEIIDLPAIKIDTIFDLAKTILSSSQPMELVFLPMRDYEHLMTATDFYPDSQLLAPGFDTLTRKLIIERSASGHFFDLAKGGITTLKNYRSLTFRPSPRPEWGNSDIAAIAYSNGYSCPPRWKRKVDPTAPTGGQINPESNQTEQPQFTTFSITNFNEPQGQFVARPRHQNPLAEIQGVARRVEANNELIESKVTIWKVLGRNALNYALIIAIILLFFFLGRLSKSPSSN